MLAFVLRYLGIISAGLTIITLSDVAGLSSLSGMMIVSVITVLITVSNIYYAQHIRFDGEDE